MGETTTTFMHTARRVSGIPPELLGVDPMERDPTAQAVQQQQADALSAALWVASSYVMDGLFEDLAGRSTADPEVSLTTDGTILPFLPRRFAHEYDYRFVQKLIVAAADLFARLTRKWSPPDCVAQELLIRVLFDHVQFYKDTYGLDLADDWRSKLAQELLAGADHDHLYGPDASDTVRNRRSRTSATFDNWFEPFDGRRLPPYVETLESPERG
ncbi:hypothetical protein [Gordonia rubripertincta]|uniref:Uncharacterized protein n=1 Tax=Gordonia rubripertincta TaxID=36822 RepID=A0ABT4N1J6_GORRU|nr:hypothetical protein [Gordonia rubripertincta]MCZ4551812.1 hypothetical protein [Gordonia rubripertincta]